MHSSEGARKDGSNGAVPGSNVQGGGKVGAIIQQRELGGDWGDDQSPGGVPPLVRATDHMDDENMWGRQRVVLTLGSGGNGIRGAPHHQGVHQEAAGDHIIEGGLPPHI